MPFPTGMATFQKNFGPAYSMVDGSPLQMSVSVTPSTSAVWAATATPLLAYATTVTAAAGLQGTLTLPSPDQAGFIDGFGNTVRNWTYAATITACGSDGRLVFSSATIFTYFAGEPAVSDLEGTVPVPSSAGNRVAVSVVSTASITNGVLTLYDLNGNVVAQNNVQGPPGPGAYDGGTFY